MSLFCNKNYGEKKLSREDLYSALEYSIDSNDEIDFLNSHHYGETLEIFADSFQNDPLMKWFEGGGNVQSTESKRTKEMIKSLFPYTYRATLVRKKGIVLGVKEIKDASTYSGAMVLKPSGAVHNSFVDNMSAFFATGPPMMYRPKDKDKFGPMAIKRLEKAAILEKKRDQIMESINEKYIYIQTIGVLTSHQGKGLGGKLLNMIILTAEKLGVPLYLETESKENESLYKHFNFKTHETYDLNVDGDKSDDATLTMYLMVRY